MWRGADRRTELVKQALTARDLFHRGKQYVLHEEKVVIVDEFTGRMMPMRRWRDGLHQMIEAKEGLALLNGTQSKIEVSYTSRGGRKHDYEVSWEGVVPNLERRYKETESEGIREVLEAYMNMRQCPACKGARLKRESLFVRFNDKSISEVTAMSIKQAVQFFAKPKLSAQEAEIGRLILKEIRERLTFLSDVGLDLREVRVDGAVERQSGREAPRHVEADLRCGVVRPGAGAVRRAVQPAGRDRVQLEQQAAVQVGESFEAPRLGEERRVGAHRRSPRVLVARVLDLADHVDPPALRVGGLIADALERQADLDLVAPVRDPALGVVQEVRVHVDVVEVAARAPATGPTPPAGDAPPAG